MIGQYGGLSTWPPIFHLRSPACAETPELLPESLVANFSPDETFMEWFVATTIVDLVARALMANFSPDESIMVWLVATTIVDLVARVLDGQLLTWWV